MTLTATEFYSTAAAFAWLADDSHLLGRRDDARQLTNGFSGSATMSG